MGNWSPLKQDLNQYLQIEFPHPVPIYAVSVQGSPALSQYVTSFKVLFSYDDSGIYHVIEDFYGNPHIFSGSVDSNTAVKNVFNKPVEAKFVRFYPLSWEQTISLRVEIFGCTIIPGKHLVTFPPIGPTVPIYITKPTLATVTAPVLGITPPSSFTISPIIPICDDPLGVENGKIGPHQIKFRYISIFLIDSKIIITSFDLKFNQRPRLSQN